MGVEDFTADLSGISSTFSSNKVCHYVCLEFTSFMYTSLQVEPSNDETANLLRSPQHSDIEEVASLARDNSAEARDDNKEGRDEVESLAISHDDTPPLLHVRPLEGDAPQRSVVEVSIDADDEVSRSSQAPTPTAETEHDRMEIDEEGVTSGDEPLQRARRASNYQIYTHVREYLLNDLIRSRKAPTQGQYSSSNEERTSSASPFHTRYRNGTRGD